MFQYSPILGHSSIWDMKFTFSEWSLMLYFEESHTKGLNSKFISPINLLKCFALSIILFGNDGRIMLLHVILVLFLLFASLKTKAVPCNKNIYICIGLHTRGGGTHFFQVRVCGPDFRSVGLANWYLSLKEGACELKVFKFGGLWAENFQIWGLEGWTLGKNVAVKAKISKFSEKGVLWPDAFAWNGTLVKYRRSVKRGSSGPHIPIPPF